MSIGFPCEVKRTGRVTSCSGKPVIELAQLFTFEVPKPIVAAPIIFIKSDRFILQFKREFKSDARYSATG